MQIIIHKHKEPETMTLEEFADGHGLVMEVFERDSSFTGDRKFYAHFSKCETKNSSKDAFLGGTYGNGASPKEAIEAYAVEISEKILVRDAMTRARKEIVVPKLVPKKKDALNLSSVIAGLHVMANDTVASFVKSGQYQWAKDFLVTSCGKTEFEAHDIVNTFLKNK